MATLRNDPETVRRDLAEYVLGDIRAAAERIGNLELDLLGEHYGDPMPDAAGYQARALCALAGCLESVGRAVAEIAALGSPQLPGDA